MAEKASLERVPYTYRPRTQPLHPPEEGPTPPPPRKKLSRSTIIWIVVVIIVVLLIVIGIAVYYFFLRKKTPAITTAAAGAAIPTCNTNNDCATGSFCQGNQCLQDKGGSCSATSQCLQPFSCTGGTCQNTPCPQGNCRDP